MTDFTLRVCRDEDLTAVAALHSQVWPGEFPDAEDYIRFWRWLFQDHPHVRGRAWIGMDANGEVIAHCGLTPAPFSIHGKTQTAGFICQLMVREDFRKTLVFPRLESTILQEYPEAGMDGIYGLINLPPVTKAHLAFGFRRLGELRVYARPYEFAGLAARFLKAPGLCRMLGFGFRPLRWYFRRVRCSRSHRIHVEHAPCFDDRFAVLLAQSHDYFSVTPLRNPDILNWRFVRPPDRTYHILAAREDAVVKGYVVTRRTAMAGFDVLAVVDFVFPPDRPEIGKALLQAVHEQALAEKVELSACLLSPWDYRSKVPRRCLYLKTPETFALILYRAERDVFPLSFQDWHLTWFDHDHV